MREGRPVNLRCVHGFATEGGGGILDQGDVIAKFHPESSSGLDAGVGHHTHQDDFPDTVLLELEVKIRIGEATLSPMLVNDDITFPRAEFRVEFSAPSAAFENLILLDHHLRPGPLLPVFIITLLVTAVGQDEDFEPGGSSRWDQLTQVTEHVD